MPTERKRPSNSPTEPKNQAWGSPVKETTTQKKRKEKKKRGGSQQAESTTGDQEKKTDGRGKSWEKENQLGRISLTEMSPTSTSWHVFVRTQSKKSDRGNG